MKKKLLLLIFLLTGFTEFSWGLHNTGAEIAYKNIAPFTYEAVLKLYTECGSVTPPASGVIELSAPGCNAGRMLTLNMIGQKIRSLNGPAFGSGCNPAYTSNMLVTTYSTTFTFSGSEQACTDWVLSWSECCRLAYGNIIGQVPIYTEAHLKLLPGLVNSSPQFDTINYPVSFANLDRIITISALAQDPDGDSLVYSSAAPLTAANQPANYAPVIIGGAPLLAINPHPLPPYNNLGPGMPGANPQIATVSVPSASYSPGFPLPSIYLDWNAINPATGVPYNPVIAQPGIKLNAQTGNITMLPAKYNNAPTPGINRYALAVQVEEYRKINGQAVKIGSVRREMFLEIRDAGPNSNPYLSLVRMNMVDIAEGELIDLRPGVTMNLKMIAVDYDTTDQIIMASNVEGILPGALFVQSGSKVINANISWTPKVSDVRDQPYYFNVVLKDNANPLRGYHERTIGVRVRQNGSVTGIKSAQGLNAVFHAFPNPFTEIVNFKFSHEIKAESIQIYNLLGKQIDEISIPRSLSGEQQVQWQNASRHAAGTYVAKLVAANKTIQTLKFVKLQ